MLLLLLERNFYLFRVPAFETPLLNNTLIRTGAASIATGFEMDAVGTDIHIIRHIKMTCDESDLNNTGHAGRTTD